MVRSERGQAGPGRRRRDAAGPGAGEGSAAGPGGGGRASWGPAAALCGRAGGAGAARSSLGAAGGLRDGLPLTRPPDSRTRRARGCGAAAGPGRAQAPRALFLPFLVVPSSFPRLPPAGQLLAACAGAIPGQRCLYSCPWVEGERPGPARGAQPAPRSPPCPELF